MKIMHVFFSAPLYAVLTTLRQWLVVAEVVDSNTASFEQLPPVYSVLVTEVGILTDVHAAIADLPEGAQSQRGEAGDVHHHQRKTPFGQEFGTQTKIYIFLNRYNN